MSKLKTISFDKRYAKFKERGLLVEYKGKRRVYSLIHKVHSEGDRVNVTVERLSWTGLAAYRAKRWIRKKLFYDSKSKRNKEAIGGLVMKN